MKNTVRLIMSESGDWEILLLNGEVYEEGHSISKHTFIDLIHSLGHEVSMEEVVDEEMEQVKERYYED